MMPLMAPPERLPTPLHQHPSISVSTQLLSSIMPSAATRPRRSSARLPASKDVRVMPVRVTVDLNLGAYDGIRDGVHDARMTHAGVLSQMVQLLWTHSRVSVLIVAAA